MNHTALYEIHAANGAKMTEFAGWRMPLSYSGVRREHCAVRSSCGIFDASHMGEIEITGPEAESLCQWLLTNDVSRMGDMRVQYSLLCNEEGGIVDDLMVYRFSRERFILCVNASNTKRDFDRALSQSEKFSARVTDISSRISLVSVQGPGSQGVVSRAMEEDFEIPQRFSFTIFDCGGPSFISRTGYTGEDGFEIFVPWDSAPEIWLKLVSTGEGSEVCMCGLGSRDTLRLEMGYSLYGNEISEEVNPFEANLGRYVKMDKGDFCGRESLVRGLENGVERSLCGLEMVEPGIPRNSYKVFSGETEVGRVTSGTMSPSLEKPVGLAFISSSALDNARRDGVQVQIRNGRRKAEITDVPFYVKSSNRVGRKMEKQA